MSATPALEPPTMRARYRAQVRGEVKQAALSQLAESGPAGLSVSAIGKQLGVSGPALYRYFASRDELLTELVIDAYHDLADALRAAATQAASQEPRARLEALARGYRSWALAQPHRYRLLFGPPLPGYDAHAQRLVDASQAAMNQLLRVLHELGDRPAAPLPQTSDGPARRACLEPPARPGEPGNRRELRVHEHRSRPGLRGTARHADRTCAGAGRGRRRQEDAMMTRYGQPQVA
jgi:AcrR family transcriptional regulator